MKMRLNRRFNYINQIFGRLTVIDQRRDFSPGYGVTILTARCECGVVKEYRSSNLKTGHTQSCGCFSTETHTSHGMWHSRVYNSWAAMIQRCTNKNNPKYVYYGDRGITVCKEWLKFKNFYNDMGDRPLGLELDRINNDKGYYKENCRWVTHLKNQNNRRNSPKV